MIESLEAALLQALASREDRASDPHDSAFRAFAGFYEGYAPLVLDVYGRTLLAFDRSETSDGNETMVRDALRLVRDRWPWIDAAVWKVRRAADRERRNGVVIYGDAALLSRKIVENGVRYAVDLTLNRDASFYLDTRALRVWAKAELAGQRVLNAFAYTGSLGVAARAAPAAEVIQLDLNRSFLEIGKRSYALNGFEVRRAQFRIGDFFPVVSRLRREGKLFDTVIVDPPFFSATDKGRVDLEQSQDSILNKVRPLIGEGGRLVVVNNALFVSGADFLRQLESLCADGYLALEQTLPVPDDVIGTTHPSHPPSDALPADPTPFNHSTKIAILRARRKDGRRATRR